MSTDQIFLSSELYRGLRGRIVALAAAVFEEIPGFRDASYDLLSYLDDHEIKLVLIMHHPNLRWRAVAEKRALSEADAMRDMLVDLENRFRQIYESENRRWPKP